MPKSLRDGARGVIAELVAAVAAVGLDDVEPLLLGFESNRNAVAVRTGAGESAPVRDLEQREPIDRWVVLRRGGAVGRGLGGEVERPAGLACDLGRIVTGANFRAGGVKDSKM